MLVDRNWTHYANALLQQNENWATNELSRFSVQKCLSQNFKMQNLSMAAIFPRFWNQFSTVHYKFKEITWQKRRPADDCMEKFVSAFRGIDFRWLRYYNGCNPSSLELIVPVNLLSAGCSHDRKFYLHGDIWRPESEADPCKECICNNGVVECSKRVCPSVVCPNPVVASGECCPKCPGNRVLEAPHNTVLFVWTAGYLSRSLTLKVGSVQGQILTPLNVLIRVR